MAQNVFLLPSFSSVKSCCEGFLGRKNTNGPSHINPPTPFAHMSSSYVIWPPRGYPVDNPTPVPQQRVLHPCLSLFPPRVVYYCPVLLWLRLFTVYDLTTFYMKACFQETKTKIFQMSKMLQPESLVKTVIGHQTQGTVNQLHFLL